MQAIQHSLNLLFPPQCGLCREIIADNGEICGNCWQKLNFISDPLCAVCGYPHEFDMGESAQCGACMANPPQFHGHRSPLYYDEHSKRLVHDLKYYDRPIMVRRLAQWMAQAAPQWLALENALLIPIPIHRYRMWKRKYNQSALLAKTMAKYCEVEVALEGLSRIKNRPPQASLSRNMRLKNLGGAFKVDPKTNLKNRPIILIDDVMTTGATVNACAKVLKQAGSGRVFCLTLARTVLD